MNYEPRRGPGPALRALGVSLRPYQWVKNTLVFAGLIFSRSLLNWDSVWRSLAAFVVLCLASSGVYLLNDLRDRNEDRLHPLKRFRPLAAGTLPVPLAFLVMVGLIVGSVAAAFGLRLEFGIVVVAYLILNIVYSLGLKKLVIVDVMALSAGFVLRAVAGAAVLGLEASPWLILCTLVLAMLIAFGKRRHELALLRDEAASHRANLEEYTLPLLDMLMGISATAAVMTYAMYTTAGDTMARFGTNRLVLTTPWVLYGVFRYLFLVHRRREGGDPSRLLVTDGPTLINGALWAAVVSFLIYVKWR